LIRHDNDLLEVLMEELAALSESIEYDLDLFYYPSASGQFAKQRETVLQTYVLRRLQDRLPGKVLDRETQVKRKGRSDIRVTSPVVDCQSLATVVVEVKWSDNGGRKRGISTGLTEQLGKKYLLDEQLTNGVFLVGWTGTLGTWRRTAGPRPKQKNAAALEEALRTQARAFMEAHSAIDIRPTVWDLQLKKEDRVKEG